MPAFFYSFFYQAAPFFGQAQVTLHISAQIPTDVLFTFLINSSLAFRAAYKWFISYCKPSVVMLVSSSLWESLTHLCNSFLAMKQTNDSDIPNRIVSSQMTHSCHVGVFRSM